MAEISSANDGGERFADFRFAPFPYSTPYLNQINSTDFPDDEWGDFVVSAPSMGLSPVQSSSKASQISEAFHPFDFFPNDSVKPSESVVTRVDSVPMRSEPEKKQWVKPQGALPLSIFGEEERASDSSEHGLTFDDKQVHSAKPGQKVDAVVGINDIISHFYSQQIKAENGSPAIYNGRNLNSNSGSNALHADVVDGDDCFDDDDGWEFKGAVPENSKGQVGSGLLALGAEITIKQEMQGKEKSDGGKYTAGFQYAFDGSGDFFAASNGLWQDSYDGAKHISGFHNVPDKSGDLFSDSNGLWQENRERAKDTYRFHSGPHESSSFFDGSNGPWKQSEGTENKSGFHNAPENSSSFFDASIRLWQEPEGAKHKSGSHNSPNDFSDLSSASDVLWQESTEASNQASGLHNAPDNSDVIFPAPSEFWQEDSGRAKYKSGFVNAQASSTDFFSMSNGLWQENAAEANISSGFHSAANSSANAFALSDGLSDRPSKLETGFGFIPTTLAQNDSFIDPNSISKLIDDDIMLNPYPGDEHVDPDENFGEFKDAFSANKLKYEEEQKVAGISHSGIQVPKFDDQIQENEDSSLTHKEALPLSLFGDEELEADNSLNYQDLLAFKPNSNPRNGTIHQAPNISINDLISCLYHLPEPSTFDDASQKPSENGLHFDDTVLDSDMICGTDDFDDDSWEFKDAFSGVKAEDPISGDGVDSVHNIFSTNVELKDYVNLYLRLKEESCYIVLCHLDILKKAKTAAALCGEDVKVRTLDEEIKEVCEELSQENILPKEVYPENGPTRNIFLDGFLKDLCGPKFQVLESEFHLSRRLSLAENDSRSAVELFKHATSMLKILVLGESFEELSEYVSTWSRMISACAQELKHGAFIWRQLLQKNVHSQIILEPRGQKVIVALGEIYRVVKVLGVSATLFKLWILSSSSKVDTFDLLEECSAIWSSSGLEDALQCICDPVDFEYGGTVQALIASIKHLHDLDVLSPQNHVFSQQKPFCQISLLTTEMVPGMKMVSWDGNHYFLMLANLWANLISTDPPNLPDLQFR